MQPEAHGRKVTRIFTLPAFEQLAGGRLARGAWKELSSEDRECGKSYLVKTEDVERVIYWELV